MFEAFDASTSGLRVGRVRMTAIANNMANIHTTRNQYGNKEPFARRLVVATPGDPEGANPRLGVQAIDIVPDNAEPLLKYQPNHPDALQLEDFYQVDSDGNPTQTRKEEYQAMSDESFARLVHSRVGYVQYPNIDPVAEMADAMMASRAYEANVSAITVSKSLINETLSLIA